MKKITIIFILFTCCACHLSAPRISGTKWVASLSPYSVMVLEFSKGNIVQYYIGDLSLYPQTAVVKGEYDYYGRIMGRHDSPYLPELDNKFGISISMPENIITAAFIDDKNFLVVNMNGEYITFKREK